LLVEIAIASTLDHPVAQGHPAEMFPVKQRVRSILRAEVGGGTVSRETSRSPPWDLRAVVFPVKRRIDAAGRLTRWMRTR
jgi:hypothetical protein